MLLDRDFLDDCPYQPEAVLLDEIVQIDAQKGLVHARMLARADLPLTRYQRVDPVRYPHHVNGGLLVHLTGILGFVHAYYVLGLRFRKGWVGVGALINRARYPNMAEVGKPLDLLLTAKDIREGKTRKVVTYDFLFRQEEKPVYTSNQTAIWMRIPAS